MTYALHVSTQMGSAEDSTTAHFHFDKTNINMFIKIIILSYNVALILTNALEFIAKLQKVDP